MNIFDSETRTLAWVPRWSIIRTITQQSVAEHSYYVADYSDRIAKYIGWSGNFTKLIRYAIQHDWAEFYTGDIPHHTKVAVVDKDKLKKYELKAVEGIFGFDGGCIDSDIKAIVSVADLSESIMYLASEISIGNIGVRLVFNDVAQQLERVIMEKLPSSRSIKESLYEEIMRSAMDGSKYQPGIHDEVSALVNFRIDLQDGK